MDNINKLLEDIKELTGITTFTHHTMEAKNFEVWVSEPDDINAYLMVDRSGNISMYEKIAGDIDKIYMSVNTLDDLKKDYAAMRMIIKIENHLDLVADNQITNGRDLLDWLEENDLTLNLDPVEAKSVMDTYLETGWTLYYDENKLFMDKNGKAVMVNVDDVIDAAAEKNYGDICQLKADLYQVSENRDLSRAMDDFTRHLDKFTELVQLEIKKKSITSAYSKTIYGKRYYYDALYANVTGITPPRRPKSR